MPVTRQQAASYAGDGLADIMLGLVLASAAFLMRYEAAMVAVLVPLVYVGIRSMKDKITVPRLRTDEVQDQAGPTGQKMFLIAMSLLLIGGVLAFYLVLRQGTGDAAWPIIAIGTAGLVALGIAVLAKRTGARRYYAYLLLGVILGLAVAYLDVALPVALGALGVAALATGAWLLQGFMRSHPKAVPT